MHRADEHLMLSVLLRLLNVGMKIALASKAWPAGCPPARSLKALAFGQAHFKCDGPRAQEASEMEGVALNFGAGHRRRRLRGPTVNIVAIRIYQKREQWVVSTI